MKPYPIPLVLLALGSGCDPVPRASTLSGKELVHRVGCTNCHDTTRQLIGPAFSAVGERYRGTSGAGGTLAASISRGSSGKWGRGAEMPPQTKLAREELQAIVDWILGPAAQ